jgi:glycosyltransferase involved in cell wall biosynthesis
MNAKRVLFVVNAPEFFLSHRLPLALAARCEGFDVHVCTGPGASSRKIEELGFVHHSFPLSRSGKNPLAEVNSLRGLYRLMIRLKPDLVHLVTIKPVLYGGFAARFARVPCVVAAVSGLGSVFVSQGLKARVLRKAVEILYRLALGHHRLRVIFQNPDDRATLVSLGALREDQAVLIRGSGVALADYPMVPETDGVPVVAFAARLLKEKGVLEFVEASRILKNRGVDARFWLIGTPDPGNPSSVDASDVAGWAAEGLIESFGYRDDIAALFAQSHVVVLPSYYGEGLPKVLIEAAACGRAVVTTNHPGCRDAIESGKTGVLVPVRDATALADTVQILLADAGLRRRMGEAGGLWQKRRSPSNR